MTRKRRGGNKRKALRRRIWSYYHGCEPFKCHWCPVMLTLAEATIDHEPPLSAGGTWQNAVLACNECNQERSRLAQKRLNRRKYHVRKNAKRKADE